VSAKVIIIIAAVMLVIGTIFAVVWWALADVIFPGTSRKTGQEIIRRRGSRPASPSAKVISDFDDTPPSA
jgi:hypothetical protein